MAAKIYCYGEAGPGNKMFGFVCPACGYGHSVLVGEGHWSWNGSLEAPTFTPNLLFNANTKEARCHSFVKDGRIMFLTDSFHKLKGQTVDLPDWDSQ
jgi:hypothetical protein